MDSTFRYANPPAIHWGPGCVADLRLDLDGVTRVGLVTTRSVAADPILMDAVRELPLAATVLIRQHAPADDVDRAKQDLAGVEALVGYGGGSPIDAAKILAVHLGVPSLAIPTTLSAAELAAGAGMTDEQGNKVGLRDPAGLPRAVFYDELLAVRTPIELWLTTGIRALDHAVEGYLAGDDNPLSEHLCLEAVRRLFTGLPAAHRSPEDAAVRGQNQVAAWFSYTLPGPSAGGLSHVMGKQVGARFGIPHGVTSCSLLPHVLRYRLAHQGDRREGLAAATGSADPATAIADLIESLEVPRRLGAFGLTDSQLQASALGVMAAFHGAYSPDDLLAIYREAM